MMRSDAFVVAVTLSIAVSCGAGSSGSFVPAPGSPYVIGGSPADLLVIDANGDGAKDLLILDQERREIVFLGGSADGELGDAVRTALPDGSLDPGPHSFIAVPIDHDEHVDLAVTAHDSNAITLMRGIGDGRYEPFSSSPLDTGIDGPAHNHGLAGADFDSDGTIDLLFGNQESGSIALLLNRGDGEFEPADDSPFEVSSAPYPPAVGDLDGDGSPDVVIASLAGTEITLLRGDANGGLAPFAASPLETDPRPFSVALASLDGNAELDLVVAHNDRSHLSVYRGEGNGEFTRLPDVEIGAGAWRVAIADFDGDGASDIAAGTRGGRIGIFPGDGEGGFADRVSLKSAEENWTVVTADLDDDGRNDIFSPAPGEGAIYVWLQRE